MVGRKGARHRRGGAVPQVWAPDWVSRLSMAVWVSSPEHLVSYVSPQAQSLLGLPPESCGDRQCHLLVGALDPSGQPFCRPGCPLAEQAARNEALEPVDVRMGGDEDGAVWVRLLAIPVLGPDGTGPWLVHCAQNVSRSRRIEEYIRRVATRSRQLHARRQGRRDRTLTPRELEILDLLVEDLGLGDVAERLQITHVTVRNHVQHILRKTGAHSIQEAVALHLLDRDERS